MSDKANGHVKWFNDTKGFGFIETDQGKDVFVHYKNIVTQGAGRRTLRENDKVVFVVTQTDKGLQAEEVEVVE